MKCIQCGKTIKDGKWCKIDCKEQMYIENYLGSSLAENIERDYREKKKKDLAKTMYALKIWQKKNPGKGYVEYLLSLGDFKPVQI